MVEKILDDFLKTLDTTYPMEYQVQLRKYSENGTIEMQQYEPLKQKLLKDGFIKYHSTPKYTGTSENLMLTFDGKTFIENGGYTQQFINRRNEEQLQDVNKQNIHLTNKKLIDDSSIHNSWWMKNGWVIVTGVAVVLIAQLLIQKFL